MALIPAGKAFLFLEELKQRFGIFAVHLDLLEARERCVVVQFTELMNAFIGAWSLLSELVTGEIKHFEALSMIGFVELFQLFILRGEATLRSSIHD